MGGFPRPLERRARAFPGQVHCQKASSVLSIRLPFDSAAFLKKRIPELRDRFCEHLTLLCFRCQED